MKTCTYDVVSLPVWYDKIWSLMGYVLGILTLGFVFKYFYSNFFNRSGYLTKKRLLKYLKINIHHIYPDRLSSYDLVLFNLDNNIQLALWLKGSDITDDRIPIRVIESSYWLSNRDTSIFSLHKKGGGCVCSDFTEGFQDKRNTNQIIDILLHRLTDLRLKCPVCKKDLEEWEERRLQTLDEHICDPNGIPSLKMSYRCPDESCMTRQQGVFWNEDGELYTEEYVMDIKTIIPFIDNNNAPFGSFQRQSNVEIFRDDKKLLFILPKWMPGILSEMKIMLKWNYKSDINGDVLKKRWVLKYLVKEDDGYYYHNWGVHMLIFGIKGILKARKIGGNTMTWELRDNIERAAWTDAEWWRKWNAVIAKLILSRKVREYYNG